VNKQQRAAVVDEFGALSRELAEFKPRVDRCKKLAEEIAGWYATAPATEAFEASGGQYIVQVSARKRERKLMDAAMFSEFVGMEYFLSVCTVPMKAIDALPRGIAARIEDAGIIHDDHTGNRTVVSVPRAQPTTSAAAAKQKRKP
jgi:hypothetical protein